MTNRIWLPPYISVRSTGDRLRLGTLPPLACEVSDPPAFLSALLTSLAHPRERTAVVAEVSRRHDWSVDEAEALISDLEDAGILVPAFASDDRYSRHQLYYRMLGVGGDPQERLQNATVGLIGMGGIGTHLAVHLTAAGIGRLVITDGDRVEASNLTRQTLYREADVGRLKVEAAAEHLRELRKDVQIETIAEGFGGPGLAHAVAEQADMILLSADRPSSVHAWTNTACLKTRIPFSVAGYIEGHGCVGPLLQPPETPCYECIRVSAEALPGQAPEPAAVGAASIELNPGYQAPSYGPLNGLVAAVQANEAIRWLIGAPLVTRERRLLIDSRTYEITWEEFEAVNSCPACGRSGPDDGPAWDLIAAQYQQEREHHSFNSVLLDDLVPALLPPLDGKRVADIGAGAGQMTARLLDMGAVVDAFEPSAAMRALLRERVADAAPPRLHIHDAGLEEVRQAPGQYHAVLCLNVLDHVPDLRAAMQALVASLRPGGTLVLSLPHPLKDRGGWKKYPLLDGWGYEHFVFDDYFNEGPCHKKREDRWGNVRIHDVQTYHRTVSTYMGTVLDCGLTVTRVLEPSPPPRTADSDPVIYTKASRVPYFLVIVATRGAKDA